MRSAATITDTAKHNNGQLTTGLGDGSPDVEVCGQPAVRAGDVVSCAEHQTELVGTGSASVTVNGELMVGDRDETNEKAVVDANQRTVLISDDRMPAIECLCPKPDVNILADTRAQKMLRENVDLLDELLQEGHGSMAMIGAFVEESGLYGRLDTAKDIASDVVGDAMQAKNALSPGQGNYSAPLHFAARGLETISGDRFYVASGLGSMKMDTAMDLLDDNFTAFEQFEQFNHIEADSNVFAKEKAMRVFLSTPKGSVEAGKLFMAQAKAELVTRDIDISAYSIKDQEAILMDCWKQGIDEFLGKWQTAANKGRIPMSGEGCALCHAYDEILQFLATEGSEAAAKILEQPDRAYPTNPLDSCSSRL